MYKECRKVLGPTKKEWIGLIIHLFFNGIQLSLNAISYFKVRTRVFVKYSVQPRKNNLLYYIY